MLGLEPAATEAEDEPSARQVVDRGRELRGQPRTAERVGADEQAEADALGHRRERRDRRPALELRVGWVALVGQQVIVDPQRVPAGALGGEARVAQLGPRRSLDPERRAEAHRSPQARVAYRRSVSGPPDFPPALRDAILDWYVSRARSLPFRGSTDPYAILVSEAMAQQTQAARAGDAWTRFMDRFPTVEALAAATPADVLRAWQGLGYNRRALNLWRAARRIVDEFGGRVPADLADLQSLPGRRAVYRAGGRRAGVRDAGRRGRHERAPRPWPDRRGRGRAVEPGRDAATGGRGGAGGSGGRLDPCRDGRRRDRVPARASPDCAACPARPWCRYAGDARMPPTQPIARPECCPRARRSVPDHLALAPRSHPGPSP